MREKSIGIVLVFTIIVFWVTGLYFFSQEDKEIPVIIVDEVSFVYWEGMDERLLLEGIRATDNVDGDLSDKIIIEKIVADGEEGSAVITYGVSDQSGNVGTASLKVEMMSVPEEEPSAEDDIPETENTAETEIVSEADNRVMAQGMNEVEAVSEAEAVTEVQSEPQTEAQSMVEMQSDPESRPSITLKSNEVYTFAGVNPAWVHVIEGLHDDKDDYGTLFRSFKVSGEYDRYTLGVYPVTVTVTDSDGNQSDAYPITIVVQ